jgi:hypothetical protein
MHPFVYDSSVSAYHNGLMGQRFDFTRHPIAPAGSKVLTWNSPDTRGSWADHGVNGIYLGPAMRHFRAFHIWVPRTCAQRVSATVWWFLKPFVPDDELLSPDNVDILYPSPTKERLHPSLDGADLLGRCFFEPHIGICCITRMGPALNQTDTDLMASLHYRCLNTQGEYFSTVEQIAQWIRDGPLLCKPILDLSPPAAAPVTYPHGLPVPTNEAAILPPPARAQCDDLR